jgi:hypothetical protein
MKRKRNVATSFLLALRHVGMLCKKPRSHKYEIRVQSTVYPDVRVSPIEAEQNTWILNKMTTRPGCKFNPDTRTCVCGIKTIDEFAVKCNSNK